VPGASVAVGARKCNAYQAVTTLKQISPNATVRFTARHVRLRASPMPTIWRAPVKACSIPTGLHSGHQGFGRGMEIGGDQRQAATAVVAVTSSWLVIADQSHPHVPTPAARSAWRPPRAAFTQRAARRCGGASPAGHRRNLDHQVERILAGVARRAIPPTRADRAGHGRLRTGASARPQCRGRQHRRVEHALGEAFAQHPDAVIITNFPGLSWEHASSARSATTAPSSLTPKPSKRSPGPRRSPVPQVIVDRVGPASGYRGEAG
jgi:hypothetical protein